MSIWNDPTRKQQIIQVNKTVLLKLKAYSKETEQPFYQVIKQELEDFDKALLKKAIEVDELRLAALENMKKQKEEAAIVQENPLEVSGHEENPIQKETIIIPEEFIDPNSDRGF